MFWPARSLRGGGGGEEGMQGADLSRVDTMGSVVRLLQVRQLDIDKWSSWVVRVNHRADCQKYLVLSFVVCKLNVKCKVESTYHHIDMVRLNIMTSNNSPC